MKRTRLSPVSAKRRARMAEVKKFRAALIAEIGCCELCGHDPLKVQPGNIAWGLCCHEIARGSSRQKALDERFALLVLCWNCHMNRVHGNENWSEARQLAILQKSRPADFDLPAYNALVGFGPHRITMTDVQLGVAPFEENK